MPVITAFQAYSDVPHTEVQVFDYMRLIETYPAGTSILRREFGPLTIQPLKFNHFDVQAGRLVNSAVYEHPARVLTWYEAFCTWAEWKYYMHDAIKEGCMK